MEGLQFKGEEHIIPEAAMKVKVSHQIIIFPNFPMAHLSKLALQLLWHALFHWCQQQRFDILENDPSYFQVTKTILQKSLRSHRHRLKKEYYPKVKNLTIQQAKKVKPATVNENDWKELLQQWSDEKFQVTHT